jgi:hypothetical protein
VGGNWHVKLDMVGKELATGCVARIWEEYDSVLHLL